MEDATKVQEFVNKVRGQILKEGVDLSSGEDLSIGVMNLISIEEHLYFSYEKTKKPQFLEMLNSVRQMRKEVLGKLVKDPLGEEWCLSKHFLATAMRFIEVGTKYLQEKKTDDARMLFDNAYALYAMFWALNLKAATTAETRDAVGAMRQNVPEDKRDTYQELLNQLMDCCKE